MRIRQASAPDWPRIWPVWQRVVAAGDSYLWPPQTPAAMARTLWMLPPPAVVYLAESGEQVLGTALLRPNHPGLGDHVANASFMVRPEHSGQGIGRQLGQRVLADAAAAGYRAMQFNAVVQTNTAAVALWTALGFRVLATVPEAFRHPVHGLVGLHIMHRYL